MSLAGVETLLEIATVLHRDSAEFEPPSLRRTTDFIFGNTPTKRNGGCRPEPCVSDGLSPSPFKKARGEGSRVAERTLESDFNSRLAAASDEVREERRGGLRRGFGRGKVQTGGDEGQGTTDDEVMSQGTSGNGEGLGDEDEEGDGWGEELQRDGEPKRKIVGADMSEELAAPEHGPYMGSGREARVSDARSYMPRPSNASTLTALGACGVAGGAGNFMSPPRVQQLMAVPRWPQSPAGKASQDEGKDNSPCVSPPRSQPQGEAGRIGVSGACTSAAGRAWLLLCSLTARHHEIPVCSLCTLGDRFAHWHVHKSYM
jgi:hypothetical protein